MPVSNADRDRLREIKTFPSLVKYLRDELDWPIESDDFEEISFDYTAEELGIDAKTAAKIQEIKQLRPLASGQPWGIFFIKFEPRRLPVLALRRILGRLVMKKRASANKSDRAAWDKHDLLFISNYGEGDERQITFAHFTDNDHHGDLPTLKVLGWDQEDTALHLDHVQTELHDHLRWPDDQSNLAAWRNQWCGAFALKHREVITTSKQLALRLADLARDIRKRCNAALRIETEKGALKSLMKAFQQALIHDLTEDDFADMYAQTISYGLLSARVSRPAGITADNLTDMVPPQTNPFLKELMETFLNIGGRKWNTGKGKLTGIDFDELGINDVVDTLRAANMDAVLRDFDNRNPQEDPVVHFYELFLKEYDAKKRMQRGVFYTPKPVVSYIVRSVHELLQTEFGLEDGLASTVTWAEMLKKFPARSPSPGTPGRRVALETEGRGEGLRLPEIEVVDPKTRKVEKKPIDPQTPFVQILDPATGTATFLVEVIDVIYKTMTEKWKKEGHGELFIDRKWNEYVPQHLLPRLHGYELMMAPYAIAHMKIGLKLFETGYKFGSGERARIYLTNALEPPSDSDHQMQIEEWSPALAHEAQAVNDVKRQRRFTVVIGNPPYSRSSANKGDFIESKMEAYKVAVRSERNIQPLSDDYIKFVRISEFTLTSSGAGVYGMITNNTYLSGRIHRGMRASLLSSFLRHRIVNLHGSGKVDMLGAAGADDENVFDILQGVSILLCVRAPSITPSTEYVDLIGPRPMKYQSLLARVLRPWTALTPSPEYFFLVPRTGTNAGEYASFLALEKLFEFHSVSGKPGDDSLLVSFAEDDVLAKLRNFRREVGGTSKRKLTEAGRNLAARVDRHFDRRKVVPYAYRPFDTRFTYYDDNVWTRSVSRLKACVDGSPILLTTKIVKDSSFAHVFVSRVFADVIFLSNTSSVNCYSFPRRLPEDEQLMTRRNAAKINLDVGPFRGVISDEADDEGAFAYVYSVLHSPAYRLRYVESLQTDFPRIPLPRSGALFSELGRLGSDLILLHLLESSRLNKPDITYSGAVSPEVEKVSYAKGAVWLDKKQTCGFAGVPEAVWNFHIGGYQVCEKWLKDRKGRTLTKADLTHYQKIVVALNETIRLMKQIDQVIEKHGGWPGAFVTKPKGA